MLEKKYLDVGQRFVESMKGTFEEGVLERVIGTLREAMRENERVLEGERRRLWEGFEMDEGDGDNSRDRGSVDVEGIERVGWPSG